MNQRVVDFRSDTVTTPCAGMRDAMATADVGDDVFGEDPTVDALQRLVAERTGFEAALWVPTGTMANQIALRALTEPGDEIIIGQNAHCWRFECGALAALAGVQTVALPGDGRFVATDLQAAYKAADPYVAPTRVVTIENTHNLGGGLVWPQAQQAAVLTEAKRLGLRTHLDGARIWNAAVAQGETPAVLMQGFDSASVCLSKGLGAPAGSLVLGSKAHIARCHRLRKMYGGGMRQVGVLAAAGIYALTHNVQRLAVDHARAQALADALDGHAGWQRCAPVETNIVIYEVAHGPQTVQAFIAAAREAGVRCTAIAPTKLRFVTHKDIDDVGFDYAVQTLRHLLTRRELA